MIPSIQLLKKARELRLFGKSLSEISNDLNIGRSTLSSWLKDIKLTEIQKAELAQRNSVKVSRGRLNALVMKKSNRVFKEKNIYDQAVRAFPRLIEDSFFMLGLSLYWAKGAKEGNCFQFTSTDRKMVEVMKKWATRYLMAEGAQISEIMYGKCIRLNISGIDKFRQLTAWQKLLIAYYDNV
jgi:hypothetical protein